MAGGNQQNWGKKGEYLAKFFIGLIVFFILLIWVYKKNQAGLS